MNNVLKINFKKSKKLTSVLGLALDGSKLEGVVLKRVNGSLQQQSAFSVTLSLDPLTAAPELVGREIRNHLDTAGVRERRCLVAVPLKWMLAAHTEIPALSDADAASFLQLESERGFPCDATTLRLGNSNCALADGKKYVLMAGIPESHLALLEKVLSAAKLKPLSFSLGLPALQPPSAGDANGVLALAIGEGHVALQVTGGGGVAALRVLEGAVESETGPRSLQTGLVARETRITLGQLPAELRESVKRIRIFGPSDLARQLADEMELRFEPQGLSVEVVSGYARAEFGVTLPVDASVSPAFSLAARRLVEQAPEFEFLPPKPTALQQAIMKYSSGRWRSVGMTAAGVLLLICLLFGYQEFQLIRLRSQWAAMSGEADQLDKLQKKIQRYRPWYDESFTSLGILRQLTRMFPEEGSVTAKTFEIRDGSLVTCSGTARNNTVLLQTLDKLRTANGIADLKVEQIRGKTPAQFTFNFHWNALGGVQ